jgi:hypothetical protein
VYYNNFDSGFTADDFGSNLLERAMVEPVSAAAPTGRAYYAVTTHVPGFVPVGVEGSRQEAGLHVVQGQW